MKNLELGLIGTANREVMYEDTAAFCDPSLPVVFSTPELLGALEEASINAVKDCYEDGEVTVGLSADFDHMAATPVGLKVRAEAKLVKIEGIVLTFEVAAFDDKEQIAKGTHKRAIINKEKFESKLEKKNANHISG